MQNGSKRTPSSGGVIRIEAESGTFSGNAKAASDAPGVSGTGYLTGLQDNDARASLRFDAPKNGLYEARIGYRSPSGEKGYALTLNGTSSEGMLPQTKGAGFAIHSAGKVMLQAGPNTLLIGRGWGYYDVDYVEFVPAAAPPRLKLPPPVCADKQATPRTRALLAHLLQGYASSQTFSGQYEDKDTEYIQAEAGRTPAVFGGDLIEYSPSRRQNGATPKPTIEQIVATVKKSNQILTLSWHWNAPTGLIDKMIDRPGKPPLDAMWYRGFYTEATTFDFAQALARPQSPEYALLLRDIDVIAQVLKKAAQANEPILWRPLHEADGGWFWWGARGPQAFVTLWRLLFDRLTHHHGLHNLLWVSSSGMKPEWYPGDNYVDIVGIDAYPKDAADPLSQTWENLLARFNGKKLLALTEFGGVPDIEAMRRFGVRWAYFVSWTGDLGPKKVSKADLARIYRSPSVRSAARF